MFLILGRNVVGVVLLLSSQSIKSFEEGDEAGIDREFEEVFGSYSSWLVRYTICTLLLISLTSCFTCYFTIIKRHYHSLLLYNSKKKKPTKDSFPTLSCILGIQCRLQIFINKSALIGSYGQFNATCLYYP